MCCRHSFVGLRMRSGRCSFHWNPYSFRCCRYSGKYTPNNNAADYTADPAVNPTRSPCQLINSQEASSLTGTTFTDGKVGSTGYDLNSCHYVSASNILTVEVAQEKDIATAKSDLEKFMTDMQSSMGSSDSQLNVTQLPTLADGGVMLDTGNAGSGSNIIGIAIGFVKGTVFFDFSDVALAGGPAPTSATMQAEAAKVIQRLP
jgi:hypothetical protein